MIPETNTGIVTGKRSLCYKRECVKCVLRTARAYALNSLPSFK
jgi:hypothetical protein